jgi:hypothetical protein
MRKHKHWTWHPGSLTCWYSSMAPHSRACFSSSVKSDANLSFPVHDKDLYVSVRVRISAHVLWRSLIWSLRERSVNPEETTVTLTAHIHTSLFIKLGCIINTLRTSRQFIGFCLLNVADREPIISLLRHTLFQSTIHCSGVLILLTIGSKRVV